MKYTKTVWEDRIAQYPNRYRDQNDNLITLTQEPGEVAQTGTLVKAELLNKIEDGLEESVSEINSLNDRLVFEPSYINDSETVASTVLKTKIDDKSIELLPCPYAVGDIFITTNELNPTTRYKGTKWKKIEEETFLMSASSNHKVKTTGGENEHTLTVDEIPDHYHELNYDQTDGGNSSAYKTGTQGSYKGRTYSTGGGKAHNNMPKFYAVYFWLRTA